MDENEIIIPEEYAEAILRLAAETGLSVETLVEKMIRDYLDRRGEPDGE